jgi:hypothetical protein
MLKVNKERLWESLMEMGRLGGLPNGGCWRQRAAERYARQGRIFGGRVNTKYLNKLLLYLFLC